MKDKPEKKKRKIKWWWGVILIIVVGVIAWRVISSQKKNGDVETATVQRGTVTEELVLSGSVQADEHATLAFQTSAELGSVNVDVGDEVSKGDALMSLDLVSLRAAYYQAEASLRAAEANLAVVYDDVKDHDDDESLDQKNARTAAETTKDSAYRAYEAARNNLSNGTLVAPFDGVISYVANTASGVNVTLGTPQVEIVNPDSIYFVVRADQSEVVDIAEGQEVLVVLDSFDEKEVRGQVETIGVTPSQGEVGAVYDVRVRLDPFSTDAMVRIGMTGDARFILSQTNDALWVDPDFVKADKDGRYVTVDKKKRVPVETGKENDNQVEVSGDISEGDTVYD